MTAETARAQASIPLSPEADKIAADPGDLDAAFEYARAAASSGRGREAISILERILRVRPDLDNVRLELASLYLAEGSPDLAAVYARRALASPTIPPDVAVRARALLGQAGSAAAKSVWQVSVSAGLRYDSNANSATNFSVVDVFSPVFGPVQVAPGVRGEADGSTVFLAQFYNRRDLGLQRQAGWETSGFVYDQRFFEIADDYNLTVAQMDTGPRVNLSDSLTLRPFLAGAWLAYGGSTYATYLGGGAAVERRGPRSLASLTATARDGRFESSSFRPQGAAYSGVEWTVAGAYSYALRPDTNFTASLGYYHADARISVLRREGPQGSLALSRNFQIGARPVSGSLRADVQQITYDAAELFIDPLRRRRDTQKGFGATLSTPLSAKAAVVGQYTYTDNDSRYRIYTFDNHSGSLSLRYQF